MKRDKRVYQFMRDIYIFLVNYSNHILVDTDDHNGVLCWWFSRFTLTAIQRTHSNSWLKICIYY